MKIHKIITIIPAIIAASVILLSQNLITKVFLVEITNTSSITGSSYSSSSLTFSSSSFSTDISKSSENSVSSITNSTSTSSASSTNSMSVSNEEYIMESIKIDPNLEKKIKNCVSKDSKIDDVVLTVYQDTINNSDGSSQIGIALAKNSSNSKKKNQAQTYTFKVTNDKVKCKSVISEIIQVKEPTKQDIINTQKKFKDFTEKMKTQIGKESKDEIKIPDNYISRKLISEKDDAPLSILDLFASPTVNAGLNSGNNPTNIYQHEDLLINTSKELGVSNKNQVAYIAATGYHETGEFVDFTEDCKCGDPYTYFENKYGRYSQVGPGLGNTSAGDGAKYLGRGYVHLTGKSNYQTYKNLTNIDIINNPNTAGTNKDLAAFITIDGMTNGRFTGVGLNSYINSNQNDYFNARRTVNGLDVAAKIEDYTRRFYLTDNRIINYNGVVPPVTYSKIMFRRKNTNQCIDVDAPTNNKVVYTWECQSWNQNQKWEVIPLPNNAYSYRRLGTTQCMEAYNPITDGTIYTWTCDGSEEQKFNYNWNTQNFYRVGALNNGQCVAKGAPSNGVRIKMYTCSAAPNNENFQWDIIGVN